MSAAPLQNTRSFSTHGTGGAGVSSVQWRREVPEAIRLLGALPDADYTDIVTATISERPAEPEQAVRTLLNSAPRGLLLLMPFVQRVFLGLRLKLRASPDRILGWKIADRGEDWIRIEAESWFMTARVVMHAEDSRMSFASFIRYDRRLAALVWPPVSLIHRQVALALVHSAVRAQ